MSDERPPCKCHGSWPLHADDQAAGLRKLGLENDTLRQAGYDEGLAVGEEAYQKLFQESIDANGRLLDENERLRARAESAEEDRDKARSDLLLKINTDDRVQALEAKLRDAFRMATTIVMAAGGFVSVPRRLLVDDQITLTRIERPEWDVVEFAAHPTQETEPE